MTTQDAVQGSSVQVGSTPATSTGTSGGSAGNNNNTNGTAGTIPVGTAVIGPKGFRLALQQMLQGWQAAVPGDSTFTSSGGALTQAAVVQQLQAYLGSYTALDAQATAFKQARQQVEGELAGARQYFAMLKLAVQNAFGPNSPQLVQFGLRPKKAARPLTSAQNAVRAAKVQATRKLRGTKGSVQKAGIKSGPMKFVEPVSEPQAAPATATANTAPPGNTGV